MVDGGIVKKLTSLIFNPKYNAEPFSLYVRLHVEDIIDINNK